MKSTMLRRWRRIGAAMVMAEALLSTISWTCVGRCEQNAAARPRQPSACLGLSTSINWASGRPWARVSHRGEGSQDIFWQVDTNRRTRWIATSSRLPRHP